MNYQWHYNRLMDRAAGRTLAGYSERHHVNPRCLGGTNAQSNLVRLTPEEHYVAHQLLVKIYLGNHKLLWAAVAMTNGTKRQPRKNKLYGWLRRKLSVEMSRRHTGRKFSQETLANMSAGQRRRKQMGHTKPHSAVTKAKMSAASKGRPKTKEHRAALAEAKLGTKRGFYKLRTDSTTGVSGVHKKRNRWVAKVGKRWLGTFATIEEAILARDAAMALTQQT